MSRPKLEVAESTILNALKLRVRQSVTFVPYNDDGFLGNSWCGRGFSTHLSCATATSAKKERHHVAIRANQLIPKPLSPTTRNATLREKASASTPTVGEVTMRPM